MASLQGKNIRSTYKGLLKTIDNDELLGQKEITDGYGNPTGVSLNNQGDVIATGKVSFDALEGNITINKFVDEADGISANDNDNSIPTSAAVKDYVDGSVTAQDLDITDGTNNGSIDLDSQSLTFTGDAGVSATVSGQTLTLDSSALQSQIDSNDSDITALQGADTTLQNNIDAEAIARSAADTALQDQITANDGDISGLDSRLTTAEGNITSNDGDISALGVRLTTAEGNISSNDTDISNLDSRLTTAEGNITSNDSDISSLQSSKQDISEKAQANGYAPLDSGAKIPTIHLPDAAVGQVEYQGAWDASTDTPTLPLASGVKGYYYVVNVAGTYQSIDYSVGDWIISNGAIWEKVDNTDAVTTVFGRLGAIVANEADYSSFYPLISDLNTTNSNVSGLDTRLTTVEGDITALEADVAVNNAKVSFDSASSTKLAGIEPSADVTDSTNVTSALASVSVTAHSDVTSAGSGAIITSAERTKLNGIEAGADVTDTANVVASLTAGSNITIDPNGTISSTASGGTYTAGTGLTLSGTTFNVNAAQPGITSLGTLTGLTTSADVTVNSLKIGRGGGNFDTNIAVGVSTLSSNVTGTNNTAIGRRAMRFSTDLLSSTAVGNNALEETQDGTGNTGIGPSAGQFLYGGSNNTLIGNGASPSIQRPDNEITLGNSSVNKLRCNVQTITSLSDARDKTQVNDLVGAEEFIKEIRPVSFVWDQRDGGRVGIEDNGFIAQELKAAQDATGHHVPGLVYDGNPDKLEASYAALLPTMVSALQSALNKIEVLEQEIANLKQQ